MVPGSIGRGFFAAIIFSGSLWAGASARAQMTPEGGADESSAHVDPVHLLVEPSRRPVKGGGAGTDSDGDGLDDPAEASVGTDPLNADSDCDNIDDGTEVGNVLSPLDGDGDGIIDALESRFVDSDGDTLDDQADPTSGWQPSCGKFLPFAVVNDESTSTRIEVRIMGGASISSVVVDTSSFVASSVFVDGVSVASANGIELFDDGSNGDRVGGDRIYTRDGITSTLSTTSRAVIDASFDLVSVSDASGTATLDLDSIIGSSFDRYQLGVIAPDDVATPQPVGASAQASSNAINLIDPMLSLEVKRQLGLESNSLQLVTQTLFQSFGDDFDFLMLFADSSHISGAFGVAQTVLNDIEGIGVSIFDNSSFWGSSGRLQTVVVRNFADNGPTLHEVAHRWGAFLDSSLGFQACTGAHWGAVGIGEGQLGGFDPATLIDEGGGMFSVEGFGTFANGGDVPVYAWMELYVMGLADASEIPDFLVPVNIDCGSLQACPGDASRTCFNADSVVARPIEDVIAIEGARVPDDAVAQTAFATAFVVVSQSQLTPAEMGYIEAQAILFGSPTGTGFLNSFQSATLDRATMDTAVEASGLDVVFRDSFEESAPAR